MFFLIEMQSNFFPLKASLGALAHIYCIKHVFAQLVKLNGKLVNMQFISDLGLFTYI